MTLRDPSYQSDIELGLADTEYIGALKHEREILSGHKKTYEAEIDRISERLARIEELLRK